MVYIRTLSLFPRAKWLSNKQIENSGPCLLCTDFGSDQYHNLMGSKFDQDPSSDFNEDPTNSICVILLTKKETDKWPSKDANGHELNTPTVETINPYFCKLY